MSKILKMMLTLFINVILFSKNLRSSRIFSLFFSPVNEASEIKKICFVSLTPSPMGLGDKIIKNSVISYIHQIYPEASIVLVSGSESIEKFKDFYLNHSHINDFLVFPESNFSHPFNQVISLIRTFWEIRKQQFNLCVALPVKPQKSDDSEHEGISEWDRFMHLFIYLCGIPERIGFCPQGNKAGELLTKAITLSSIFVDRHWSDYAVGCAQALGSNLNLKPQDLVPYLRFQVEEISDLNVARPIIVVHAGGDKYWNRRWPLQRYQQVCLKLCQELNASVYLLGGVEENVDNEWIKKNVCAIHPTAHIYNLSGTILNQTINYIHKADLFVGNDSGPMHIAIAVGTPTIALFGPSHPLFWAGDKIDSKHLVISNNHYCQNGSAWSSTICKNSCPMNYNSAIKIYPECLNMISVDKVWSYIQKQLIYSSPK